MAELEKVRRVANPHLTLFVGDALAGNDAVDQARNFQQMLKFDGAILTKLDTDAKGGAGLSIAHATGQPIVLCGVGNSGLIASKIAATLSSVGTPAFNLSAGDSSHGDLGSISKKDILILISYSGQTNELKNIIQYANRNKIF